MVAINARSELVHARLMQFEEVVWFAPTEPPAIEPAPDDLLHTVTALDRLDNLAFIYYGDSRLQWVLKHINNIFLLPNDLVQGDVIRVPSFERLEQQGYVVR